MPLETNHIAIEFSGYYIKLREKTFAEHTSREHPDFSDKIMVPYLHSFLGKEVLPEVRKMSSLTPPATWQKDLKLKEKLGIRPIVPCTEDRREEKPEPPSVDHLTLEDIMEGVYHRNSGMRAAAARILGNAKHLHQGQVKSLLQALATDDKSEDVRSVASYVLKGLEIREKEAD